MNNELANIFSQLAELTAEMSKLYSRAAEICGNEIVSSEKSSGRLNQNDLRELLIAAERGDVPAILKLKVLAKENSQAYSELEKLYYDGDRKKAVGTIILRDGLRYIEHGEFKNLKNITHIIFPEGLTGIGDNAFEGCISLEELTLPEGLTSIGNNAFKDCHNLKEIYFPRNCLTLIGTNAFYGCNLKSITYHKKTEYIILRNAFGAYWQDLEKKVAD